MHARTRPVDFNLRCVLRVVLPSCLCYARLFPCGLFYVTCISLFSSVFQRFPFAISSFFILFCVVRDFAELVRDLALCATAFLKDILRICSSCAVPPVGHFPCPVSTTDIKCCYRLINSLQLERACATIYVLRMSVGGRICRPSARGT